MSNSINNPKMKKSIFTILSITILILAWQLLTMLVRLPDLVPSIPCTFRIRFILSISHGDSVAWNHRDVYIVNGGYGSFSLVLQMRVDL